MMEKVLLIGIYKYPNGDADAVRQHSFAKIYKELGYDVTVLGMGVSTGFQIKENDGISYISMRSDKTNLLAKLKNYFRFASRLKKFLRIYGGFNCIQMVDIPPNALFFLKKYAQKHNTKLIYDSVEWYSPEQFVRGKFSLAYILKEKYNTKWIDEQFSVIAISSYLEKHFKSQGINTVRIPVIMDISSLPYEKQTENGKTVFLYAGSPGKKDYLAEIIKGFAMLPQELLSRTELQLLGIKKDQLTLYGVEKGAIEHLGKSLVCFGRIPREMVLERLSKADFTVLLRSETQRYAKAGFPTKAVESLATATPVISNLTSDLGLYLHDGYNSIIVKDETPLELSISIKKAIATDESAREKMCVHSRKTAEKYFDYSIYKNIIADILEQKG